MARYARHTQSIKQQRATHDSVPDTHAVARTRIQYVNHRRTLPALTGNQSPGPTVRQVCPTVSDRIPTVPTVRQSFRQCIPTVTSWHHALALSATVCRKSDSPTDRPTVRQSVRQPDRQSNSPTVPTELVPMVVVLMRRQWVATQVVTQRQSRQCHSLTHCGNTRVVHFMGSWFLVHQTTVGSYPNCKYVKPPKKSPIWP